MFYKDIDTLTTYIRYKAGLQQNWEVQEAECTDKLVVFDCHLPCEFAIPHVKIRTDQDKNNVMVSEFSGYQTNPYWVTFFSAGLFRDFRDQTSQEHAYLGYYE